MKISVNQAKQYIINYQGFTNSANSSGKKGIIEFIKHVGSIQYDPLNVVGRNPDLILQSRIENYKTSMLNELLYSNRELIDGWDKMMSIYPVNDWPYFTFLREIKAEYAVQSLRYRNSIKALDYIEKAVSILKNEGPKLSAQMNFGKSEKNKWGHGKLAGAALDYLFHKGIVGVSEKKGTQKVYDLIENIIPENILSAGNPFSSIKDFHKWLLMRRIGAIGLYWNTGSIVWQGIDDDFNSKKYRDNLLSELLEEGLLETVEIEGYKQQFYIKAEYPFKENIRNNHTIKFLAPLDSLLWDRKFISSLFDFDYKWEVYTPAKQRKYGYYILPVLRGNDFIGRFEPLIDKISNDLIINNIWFEDGVIITAELKHEMHEAVKKFAQYLEVKSYCDKSNTLPGLQS